MVLPVTTHWRIFSGDQSTYWWTVQCAIRIICQLTNLLILCKLIIVITFVWFSFHLVIDMHIQQTTFCLVSRNISPITTLPKLLLYYILYWTFGLVFSKFVFIFSLANKNVFWEYLFLVNCFRLYFSHLIVFTFYGFNFYWVSFVNVIAFWQHFII